MEALSSVIDLDVGAPPQASLSPTASLLSPEMAARLGRDRQHKAHA